VVLAGALVSVAMFLPFKLADVGSAAYGQQTVFRELERRGIHHAVVFHRNIVPPWLGLSWAYFPPPNPPRLDGDILFAMLQTEPPLERNLDFWKRRFPDREAWFFGWDAQSGPFLVPLADYVALARNGASVPGRPVSPDTPGR
jgi:hypothetical protein